MDSVVVVAGGAAGGAAGAGVEVLVSVDVVVSRGVVVVLAVVVPVAGGCEAVDSVAPAAAGASTSAPRTGSSRRIAGRMSGWRFIASISCRAGS
jgi:hypothetical protein